MKKGWVPTEEELEEQKEKVIQVFQERGTPGTALPCGWKEKSEETYNLWVRMQKRTKSVVYFMGVLGDGVYAPEGHVMAIKVGCSSNVDSRLAACRTHSPFPVEILATVPGVREDEKNLHRLLVDHHKSGEWFHPHQDVFDLMVKLQEEGLESLYKGEESECGKQQETDSEDFGRDAGATVP